MPKKITVSMTPISSSQNSLIRSWKNKKRGVKNSSDFESIFLSRIDGAYASIPLVHLRFYPVL
jgi:hypothetical protein